MKENLVFDFDTKLLEYWETLYPDMSSYFSQLKRKQRKRKLEQIFNDELL